MDLVFPGEAICSCTKYKAGPGTHIENGTIVASVVGVPQKTDLPEENTVMVFIPTHKASETLQPHKDDLVWCQITKITMEKASASILKINNTRCKYPIQATLPKTNIVAEDKGSRITQHVQLGDIVVARVVGQSSALLQEGYLLTIVGEDCGVVEAKAAATNNTMQIHNAHSMIDPQTGVTEKRKCRISK